MAVIAVVIVVATVLLAVFEAVFVNEVVAPLVGVCE